MTPLMMAMCKAELDGQWPSGSAAPPAPISYFSGAHPFEATAVLLIAQELAMKLAGDLPDHTAFLPFAKTWIEYKLDGGRVGFLLERSRCGTFADVDLWQQKAGAPIWGGGHGLRLPLMDNPDLDTNTVKFRKGSWADPEYKPGRADGLAQTLYAILAIINTPRIAAASREHAPHKAFSKRMASQSSLPSYAPKSWTEVIIKYPGMPQVTSGDERGPTGDKCRHWVRSFWGIRWGKVCLIREHERGNPALGTKQSKYRLAA